MNDFQKRMAKMQNQLGIKMSHTLPVDGNHSSEDEFFAQYASGRLEDIKINQIVPNKANPRLEFNEQELQALADSIEELGLLQPITVRKLGLAEYEIVAGERRFRACKMLGRTVIPCIVVTINDENNALLAIAENTVRDNLCAYEVARGIIGFQSKFPNRAEYAKTLGIKRQDLYRYLAFDKLAPSIKAKLEKQPSLITAAVAERLATLVNKGADPASMERYTLDAMDLVEKGKLKHSKVDVYVEEALAKESGDKPEKVNKLRRTFSKGGLVIGKVTQDHRSYTVKLATAELSSEQKDKLEQFLEELLA